MRTRIPSWSMCVVAALLLAAAPASAFAFAFASQDQETTATGVPIVWPTTDVIMNLDLRGPNRELINGSFAWVDNAVDALDEWSGAGSAFSWTDSRRNDNPCNQDDDVNVASFQTSLCGESFGDAIAVTLLKFRTNPAGQFVIVNADVLFDANRQWNAYDGGLRNNGGEVVYDFRRVALHEFGHALGLAHPDEIGQTVRAVMNSRAQSVDRLQTDDRRGIAALYPSSPDAVRPAPASQTGGAAGGDSGGGGSVTWLLLLALCLLTRCSRRPARR